MDHRIQRVVAFMHEKPDGRLTLAAMARIAGLSSSRFRHKFKSEIGVTPTTYLQMLRLHKARKLLASSNLTVKEVKASIGITSDSYFTHQFKRAFGIPPSRSKAGIIEPMVRIESTVPVSTVSERREAFPHRDAGISTKELSLPGQHCEAPAKNGRNGVQ
jgi:AraC-like DNA-binding protein